MPALAVTHVSPHAPAALYHAFTQGLALWFAEPGTLTFTPSIGAPFRFEVVPRDAAGREIARHPHFGRVLALEPSRRVTLSWMTRGTEGVETVLDVQFAAVPEGTEITLTHDGFASDVARDRHAASWPGVLQAQSARLGALTSAVAVAVAATPSDPSHHVEVHTNRSMPPVSVLPTRSYPDVNAAVTFLRDVLECRVRLVQHGERAQLMVGEHGAIALVAWQPTQGASGDRPPATLLVRVRDVDAAFSRALSLGAQAVAEPYDTAVGERQAVLKDPAGHSWTLSQTITDVDPAQWGATAPRHVP